MHGAVAVLVNSKSNIEVLLTGVDEDLIEASLALSGSKFTFSRTLGS